MAERKRRPPSNKVKPGTPHPTKAYTVRGYDGKWISRKAFNAAKRARAAKEKGGALVKRTSSAVTKVADKAGELLKIKKGDKGIVRGIKDTYKLGKDTRRSARAAYKAGQITREVYDKLVKGGKDFFGGVKEAGKATRRAYERTKPGGKIVRTSKDAPKFNYDAMPRQKGGPLVKNSGGKIVKSPGGKLVKTPKSTKKTTTPRSKVKLNERQRVKVKQQGKTVKSDTDFNRRWKVKGSKTNPFEGKPGKDVKVKTRPGGKYGKSIKGHYKVEPVKTAKKVVKNVKSKIPKSWDNVKQATRLKIAKGLKNPVVKGTGKLISKIPGSGTVGKAFSKSALPLTIKEAIAGGVDIVKMGGNAYRVVRDGKTAKLIKEVKTGPIRWDSGDTDKMVDKHHARREKILSEQNLKGGKELSSSVRGRQKKNATTETVTKERIEKQKDNNSKAQPIGKADKTNKEPAKVIGNTDEKSNVNNLKVKDNKKKKVTVGTMVGAYAGTNYKPAKKKKTEAELKKDWLKRTRNSPARKSGAFTDDQLWKQHKKHQKWKKANNRR